MRYPLAIAISCAILALAGGNAPARAEDDKGRPDSFDLLGYFPRSDTASRIRPYQFRVSFLTGPVAYTSANAASDSKIQVAVQQLGFRLESDRWFQMGSANRRPIGILADYQKVFVSEFRGIQGDPVRYSSASLLFGWRFLGYGHTQPWTSEAALLVGPAYENFPIMQLSFDQKSYRLAEPKVLGTRLGIRGRIPLIARFQLLSLELAGYVTIPHLLLGDIEGSLDQSLTRSLGGNALIDFKVFDGVILGAGGYLGWYTLSYTPEGAATADKISFLTQSFVTSVRILF
jgi:hypothetical protein